MRIDKCSMELLIYMRNSVANPRKFIKPTTSVTVVNITAPERADLYLVVVKLAEWQYQLQLQYLVNDNGAALFRPPAVDSGLIIMNTLIWHLVA